MIKNFKEFNLIKENRELGTPLSEQTYKKVVPVYRAVANDVDSFYDRDYVTLSKQFAVEHAENNHIVYDDQYIVIKSLIPTTKLFNASNPGEYLYHGDPLKGEIIYKTLGYDFEGYDEINWDEQPITENYSSLNENIYVFHGSDRKFDEFDMDKIGSGEGKSLGGWGLYFSDDESVSQRYVTRHGFLKEFVIKDGPYFDLDAGMDSYEAADMLEELEEKGIDEYELEQFQTDYIDYSSEITNRQVYEWLEYVLGDAKNASLFLNEIGYVGTKFKDRINIDSTNYVVFDTRYIKSLD